MNRTLFPLGLAHIRASHTEETKLSKTIELHQGLKKQFMDEGLSSADASKKAYELVMESKK